MEQAIPPDVELTHSRATVHTDGSLEFTGPPPALSRNRHEGSRLYPAWPPCVLRMLRVQVFDGLLSVEGICGSPEAGQFTRTVVPS
jgi:hypothetical protein